jgi:hypothetical protein
MDWKRMKTGMMRRTGTRRIRALGQTIDIERVREHYHEAMENPAEEAVFKQLRLKHVGIQYDRLHSGAGL